MAISPVCLKFVAVFEQFACEDTGIGNDLFRILFELGFCSEFKRDCNSSDGLYRKKRIESNRVGAVQCKMEGVDRLHYCVGHLGMRGTRLG